MYSDKELKRIKETNEILVTLKKLTNNIPKLKLESSDVDSESIIDDIESIISALEIHLATSVNKKWTVKDEIKKLKDEAMVKDWEEQADNMIDEWINNPFKFNKGGE